MNNLKNLKLVLDTDTNIFINKINNTNDMEELIFALTLYSQKVANIIKDIINKIDK